MSEKAPTGPPSILTQSVDVFSSQVLDRIPVEKKGIVRADVSNTGIAIAAGVRLARGVSAVGFAEKKWGGKGYTAGARAEFKF